MSKRGYIIVFSIIGILLAGCVTSFFVYRFMNQEKPFKTQGLASEKITDECTEEADLYKVGKLQGGEDTEEVNNTENKLSPNAELVIKKNYKECGHTTKEYAELPQELVNLNQEEVSNQYPDFEIEEFMPSKLVLYKEMSGICNEHYLLKEKDGVVVVYTLDKQEKETFLEKTGVSVEYLPDTDKNNLRTGIRVYGKEQLNTILEDFE